MGTKTPYFVKVDMQEQLKLFLENNDIDEIIKCKSEREQKENCWLSIFDGRKYESIEKKTIRQ